MGWRRIQKDPFVGEWEQITSSLIANPQRSSGDIFRELQRLSPRTLSPLANPHPPTLDSQDPNLTAYKPLKSSSKMK